MTSWRREIFSFLFPNLRVPGWAVLIIDDAHKPTGQIVSMSKMLGTNYCTVFSVLRSPEEGESFKRIIWKNRRKTNGKLRRNKPCNARRKRQNTGYTNSDTFERRPFSRGRLVESRSIVHEQALKRVQSIFFRASEKIKSAWSLSVGGPVSKLRDYLRRKNCDVDVIDSIYRWLKFVRPWSERYIKGRGARI